MTHFIEADKRVFERMTGNGSASIVELAALPDFSPYDFSQVPHNGLQRWLTYFQQRVVMAEGKRWPIDLKSIDPRAFQPLGISLSTVRSFSEVLHQLGFCNSVDAVGFDKHRILAFAALVNMYVELAPQFGADLSKSPQDRARMVVSATKGLLASYPKLVKLIGDGVQQSLTPDDTIRDKRGNRVFRFRRQAEPTDGPELLQAPVAGGTFPIEHDAGQLSVKQDPVKESPVVRREVVHSRFWRLFTAEDLEELQRVDRTVIVGEWERLKNHYVDGSRPITDFGMSTPLIKVALIIAKVHYGHIMQGIEWLMTDLMSPQQVSVQKVRAALEICGQKLQERSRKTLLDIFVATDREVVRREGLRVKHLRRTIASVLQPDQEEPTAEELAEIERGKV